MIHKSVEMLMIESLAIHTGNFLAALAYGNDSKIAVLDQMLTKMQAHREGTPNDDIYRAQMIVSESLRFGADKMIAAHHKMNEELDKRGIPHG